MSATTQININGQIVQASSVTLPSTGRAFRDAWTLNGDVVEVDLPKARKIAAYALVDAAAADAAKADRDAIDADLGNRPTDVAAARARGQRRRATPNLAAIENAADAAGLAALTIDDIT